MKCEYGGEVTFTTCEPGYRLRLDVGAAVSVILSKDNVRQLQERIEEVLALDEKGE